MSSHAEEARPQLMGQIPEHYTKFRWRYSTIGLSISPGEEKTCPSMENDINFLDFLNIQRLKGHKKQGSGPTVMNWIQGSALQENIMKNRGPRWRKRRPFIVNTNWKAFETTGNCQPCVRAQKHLGTVSQLLWPGEEFFPRLFRNHTIARSQQLARLCVCEPTRWISQALPWQGWQCLHWGSSATAANLILTFSSSSSLSPPPLTACCSSSPQPQRPTLPSWFFKQGFLWLNAAASSELMQILAAAQTLQWPFLC